MNRTVRLSWLLACATMLLACSQITSISEKDAGYFDSMETRESQVGDPAPGFLRGDGKLMGHGVELPCGELRPDGSRLVHKWGRWVTSYMEGPKTVAIESIGEFRDSHREGEWTFWHRNGAIRARGSFSGSQMTGRWVCTQEDGSIDAEHSGEYSGGQRVRG